MTRRDESGAAPFAPPRRPAPRQPYTIAPENAERFGALLRALCAAYENPEGENGERIDGILSEIRRCSAGDGILADSVAAHWRRAFQGGGIGGEHLWRPGDANLGELDRALRNVDAAAHAFVVLGYELQDGRMTDELRLRCDAAAAAAQAYPRAILVCSGGATGPNNPDGHTEAGEMKAYLSGARGVDPARIYVDEAAMSTVENAVNTFEILRMQGTRTLTVVTSLYHQRWGQALYNAEAALYTLAYGDEIALVGGLSCEVEPDAAFGQDYKWAASQLASILALPEPVRRDVHAAIGMNELFQRFLAARGIELTAEQAAALHP